jgi:ABC-type bacteriocin/lantibiotic exporter with double-glycine peptidase domain
MSFFKDLGTIIVLWFGAHALMEGSIGKGDLVAFLILVRYF